MNVGSFCATFKDLRNGGLKVPVKKTYGYLVILVRCSLGILKMVFLYISVLIR